MRPSLRNVHRLLVASFAALALLLPAAVGAQDIVRGLDVGDSTFDGARESAAPDQALPVAGAWAADTNLAKTRDDADASEARAAEDRLSAADAAREAAETQVRATELERALAAPALSKPAGAPIELPFPGPDGRTPITTIKPTGPVQALPFPAVPGAIPAPRAAQPTDPRVQQLIDALTPKRPPAK